MTRATLAAIPLVLVACAPAETVPSRTFRAAKPAVTEIDPRIWCIHQASDGDYWFGSNGNGVYRYDGAVVTRYGSTDGLVGDRVRSIRECADGALLVATSQGVSKLGASGFVPLEIRKADPGDSGWVLDPRDTWIVCSPGQRGPCRYDGEVLHELTLSESPVEQAARARFPDAPFPPDGVYTIYEDRRGHLWFGTSQVGLCRFDGKSLRWMFEERLTTTPDGGAFGIRSIFEDRAGHLWVCNTRQRFEVSPSSDVDGEFRGLEYETRPGLPDAQSDASENFVYYSSMTQDDTGALWMACGSDGVWRFVDDEVTRFALAGGSYAITLCRDRGGTIWVGTLEHGIYTLEASGFERFVPRTAGK